MGVQTFTEASVIELQQTPCLLFIQLEYLFCLQINSCCTNPSVILNSVSAFFSAKTVKKLLKNVKLDIHVLIQALQCQ